MRIFDLEWQQNRTLTNAHQFGDMDQQLGMGVSINLLVRRGHLRFLLPSIDKRPASWSDWVRHVGAITANDWPSWSSLMRNGTGNLNELTLYPCRTCFELWRFTHSELQTPNSHPVGGSGGLDDSDIHHNNMRQLYTLFGIYDLPVLTPTTGRI